MDPVDVIAITAEGAFRRDQRPAEAPGPHDVVVQLAATGLNRADLLQRDGHYPAPPGVPADVPGLEFAGTVAATGPRVTRWTVGDRVCGLVGGGAFASALTLAEDQLLPVPEGLDVAHAAALPEALLTAFDALVLQAGLAPHETVLVHAAASGVGTAAVQVARLVGARSLGTTRTADKLAHCTQLGLDVPLHVPKGGSFVDAVRQATDGRGVDVILDLVGAAYLEQNLAVLAPRGRLIAVGLLGGATGSLPLARLLARRARLIGTVLRSRSAGEKAALVAAARERLWPAVADGRIVPVVDAVLPVDQLDEACARLAGNTTVGKLVLTW